MPDNKDKTPPPKSKRTIEERVSELRIEDGQQWTAIGKLEDRIAYLEMQEAELVLVGEMEGRLKKVEEQAHIHDEEGNVAELYNEPEDNEPDIERLAEVAHFANSGVQAGAFEYQAEIYQNVMRRIARAILKELGHEGEALATTEQLIERGLVCPICRHDKAWHKCELCGCVQRDVKYEPPAEERPSEPDNKDSKHQAKEQELEELAEHLYFEHAEGLGLALDDIHPFRGLISQQKEAWLAVARAVLEDRG